MVALVRHSPKVYIKTRRINIVAEKKSKAQVFLEISEAHEQQQEDQHIDSDEEILKEEVYTRTSKNKKEELELVAGARWRHINENNKYRMKSKALNSPSFLTEVIVIEEQHVELQTKDPSIAEITRSFKNQRGKAPMD